MCEEKDNAESTPFVLKNVGSSFEGRSSGIFGQLDDLERKHISHEQNRTDLDDFADLRQDKDDGDFVEGSCSHKSSFSQGKNAVLQRSRDSFNSPADRQGNAESDACSDKPGDSDSSFRRERKHDRQRGEKQLPKQEPQFRRPSGRAPGRNRGRHSRMPDHGKRPHSWTYYSLEDVSGSDMSDKSNTQAALAFLDERRKLKAKQEEEMSMEEEEAFDVGSAACSKGVFSFAKRNKTDKSSNMDDTHDKNTSPVTDKHDRSSSTTKLASSDTETLDDETVEPSSSTEKDDKVQTGFKNRKGIRRNIRARDDDD